MVCGRVKMKKLTLYYSFLVGRNECEHCVEVMKICLFRPSPIVVHLSHSYEDTSSHTETHSQTHSNDYLQFSI